MSKFLTQSKIVEFDDEVKHEFGALGGGLRPSFSLRQNVVGGSYRFQRMGRGMAQQKATQADVTPMDVTYANQTAVLGNWYAAEYTDIFDQVEVNFDEQTELAKVVAGGIRRREDQLCISEVQSGTYHASTIDPDIGRLYDVSATYGFGLDIVHQAAKHFQELELINDPLHFMINPAEVQRLLQQAQYSSLDYTAFRPLAEGKAHAYWMGFNWHVIGNREEGGIIHDSSLIHNCYAWAQSALGLAIGIDMKTEINYIPVKTSWLINCLYKGGTATREQQGKFECKYLLAAAAK